jgi:transposase
MGRKKSSKELKAQIILYAIKDQKTIVELVSEYAVHANLISMWKNQLLDAATDALSSVKDKDAEQKEVERDHLYKKVGLLQIDVGWLKKERLSAMSISRKSNALTVMIMSLELVVHASCCNYHYLLSTDPGIPILKVLTTWNL